MKSVMDRAMESVLQRLASRQGAMVETLAEWVAIPTGKGHTPGLDRFREIMTSRLERIGADVITIEGMPKAAWLGGDDDVDIPPTVVCSKLIEDRPRILIAGHLDTVFDRDDPFNVMTINEDGETAIGPGVVDMKGGLLIALEALEALHAEGVEVGWTFVLNSDEETGSYHSHDALYECAKAHDVGLATEPALPGGGLAVARKGSGQFMIETHGKSAHAGREFEKGVSAVYKLAHVLCEVEKLSDLDRGVTVNVGPLQGGKATNIVPPLARAWGNIRFPEPTDAIACGEALDAMQTPAGELPGVVAKWNFSRPAKPATPESMRLAEMARDSAELLGQSMAFVETGGVCDGNILQSAGLPTIDTLGVRGGGLHTTDEWIELASLSERARLMAHLLKQLDERWGRGD